MRRATIVLSLAAGLGLIAFIWWRQVALERRLKELSWDIEVASLTEKDRTVSLDVGTIQFFDEHFSVTFDSISYDPAGVRLVGRIGNHGVINLSGVTLGVEIRPPVWSLRDAYMKSDDPFFLLGRDAIGKAQVAIGDIGMGRQASFVAVVPNVKQAGW